MFSRKLANLDVRARSRLVAILGASVPLIAYVASLPEFGRLRIVCTAIMMVVNGAGMVKAYLAQPPSSRTIRGR